MGADRESHTPLGALAYASVDVGSTPEYVDVGGPFGSNPNVTKQNRQYQVFVQSSTWGDDALGILL